MPFGNPSRYMINEFSYALNVWAFEVFPIFRGFSKHKGQKFPRMLCWGPSKQAFYCVIIDNFFHAENRFNKFIVNVVVGTEQERQNYPVALQFSDDSSSCSSNEVERATHHALIIAELEEQVRCRHIDLKTPSSNQVIPSPNLLEVVAAAEVSRKSQRCEYGREDDCGFPNWSLITPNASTIDKWVSSGTDT
ncbi:hypothetical protein K7X08_038108 [Anisodus acutangulus]|uniref:Uncharacterized protein n=1 Tax=Anisodus acutangulus TaxID=402998 RepID=A0A9Q1RSN6_9SOLA|nr:hypothetical protein K7X08_038108 [Anisodus acutangulus]